ncbi:MAG: prepilin-type N-terminal cleavage/methylation domain-containing protein [Planctomycetaceae bacterium]|nr:prepilin-type N-terminal cleavage/methylation domain-containing protein [Planctomycetaceae bacterium]
MNRRFAFTLVELMIVIAIIAILVTILVPVIANSLETANKTKCASNLKVIGNALHAFAHDNNARFPSIESTAAGNAYGRIGYNNNDPTTLEVADATRPLFMLMALPNGATARTVGYAAPAAFVCPSVSGARTDPIALANQVGFTSDKNISYSYQHQIKVVTTGFRLGLLTGKDKVVLADRSPLTEHRGVTGTAGGSTWYAMEATTASHGANSTNHRGVGQNVLRANNTVAWTSSVAIGPDNDTIWDPSNKLTGSLSVTELPQSTDDIFLVP